MTAGVIACGALAAEVGAVARRRQWPVAIHPLPALLHNQPERIAPELERQLRRLCDRYERVAVAYGDCGSYGAIDEVLRRFGVARLRGDHCYDVFAREEVSAALEQEPGTYFLTDFLARTFRYTVVRELGLDRYPELRDEYFRHYRRVLWLAGRPTPATRAAAERAADILQLPLFVRRVGTTGLERQLAELLGQDTEEPALTPLSG
ncbi:MAG: DUF1638 domain-containing protein [Solirubrobacterales bacterium]|nr:DUF1638 domain-containing protein [Solirubrobacterales bacterium]MBV9717300.1 DUF1638 domain-containing protein [Solirubrobacterales bacterium]